MSIFDDLKRQLNKGLNQVFNNGKKELEKNIKNTINGTNKKWTVTWSELPKTLDELKALPEAQLKEPYQAAALTVAALCRYSDSREDSIAMLDYLRGPASPMSQRDKDFIRDRHMDGQTYIARSYFEGAVPDNDYTPSKPYKLIISANPVPIPEENYMSVLLTSGGADSPRQITLRNKPSTGQWFLWEQFLLSGIRIPKSKDAWA